MDGVVGESASGRRLTYAWLRLVPYFAPTGVPAPRNVDAPLGNATFARESVATLACGKPPAGRVIVVA